MICRARWFLVGLLWLLLWSTSVWAGEEDWRKYNTAGIKAYERGDYVDAEKLWSAALEEAEELGVEDPRSRVCRISATSSLPGSRSGMGLTSICRD